MTKIRNIFNNGSKYGGKTGIVRVDGGNLLKGGNVLAVATTGTVIRNDNHLNRADYFQCNQTSAGTDLLLLPDNGAAWGTGTAYVVNEKVVEEEVTYLCVVAHTANASFAVDKAAGKWVVDLDSEVEIGTKMTIYAIGIFAIRSQSKAIKLNNVTGTSKVYTTVAGDMLECVYTLNTGWIAKATTIAGAAKTATPAT